MIICNYCRWKSRGGTDEKIDEALDMFNTHLKMVHTAKWINSLMEHVNIERPIDDE